MTETPDPVTVAQASALTAAPRKRPRPGLWLVFLVTLANIAGIAAYEVMRTHPGGDELRLDAVGWHGTRDVGATFTDAMTVLPLTSQQRGPLRLISARPLMDDGGAVRVLGVLARVLPSAEPVTRSAPGFPPAVGSGEPGAVEVAGLPVPASTFDANRSLQLLIGYEVVASGRSARLGIELVYEHGGFRHRAVIPSRMTICVPGTAACAPGPVTP